MVHILEDYAKENNIPIMMKDGIEFLCNYLKENNYKTVLEIGTAIGYSAIKMCLADDEIKVVSIERDKERYDLAIQNIKKFGMEDRINVILDDAFNVQIEDKFDLIFIDAAKSQYIKFFEKFKVNLNDNGTILSDNLDFHGLVNSNEKIESRNVRGLVRKINEYIEFLKNNKEFNTKFISIGDGIGISKKSS